MSADFIKQVVSVQHSLKVPKAQRNSFGNYNYRSCEDILEAAKPILADHGLMLTISDDVIEVAGRVYIRATATITDGDNSTSNTAMAREAMTKKGMDDSQITGTASSYARKYALNGLLLIDDTRDADTADNSQHDAWSAHVEGLTAQVNKLTSMADLQAYWKRLNKDEQAALTAVKDAKKSQLQEVA